MIFRGYSKVFLMIFRDFQKFQNFLKALSQENLYGEREVFTGYKSYKYKR